MKHINNMTRKELLAVPMKTVSHEHIKCDSFVIIQTGKKHDSGYGKMAIIACDDLGFPICKTIDYADDLNLLMYDRYGKYSNPRTTTAQDDICYQIRIDCLPVSKALHVWGHTTFDLGSSGSSYGIKCYETKKD
jgi:hypothetical protein